jgi:hypothetical protein
MVYFESFRTVKFYFLRDFATDSSILSDFILTLRHLPIYQSNAFLICRTIREMP